MSLRFLAALTLALTVGLGCGFAQLGNATLVGRVQDSTGSLVVAADVEVKRVSTNELFRMKTTGSGDYSVVNLPVGEYEVRVSTPGFKTEVRTGITFHPVKTMDDVLALALLHTDFAADVPAVAPH